MGLRFALAFVACCSLGVSRGAADEAGLFDQIKDALEQQAARARRFTVEARVLVGVAVERQGVGPRARTASTKRLEAPSSSASIN